jgi:hypothetical protein
MLYCPRCNNTHWSPTEQTKLLLLLRLKKELQCGKCGKVMPGSIFMRTSGTEKERKVHCPSCTASATRSRRTGFERLLFFLRAYRCKECKTRFRRVHLRG